MIGHPDTLLDGALAEVARRGFLDALLPTAASDDAAHLWDALLGGVGASGLELIVQTLVTRKGEYASHYTDRAIGSAEHLGVLPAMFSRIISAGKYEQLVSLLAARGIADPPGLVALSRARPMYGKDQINQEATRAAQAGLRGARFDVLIVPGYTPVDARAPVPLSSCAPARLRVEAAVADFQAQAAPLILVSGGSVYPSGTPHNEALMMREYLLAKGVPAGRVLVDPHARHSTTNLRNAGRLMHELGLRSGLIVTGFDREVFSQQFYYAHQDLSTFAVRCQRDLGYRVGDLTHQDDHHVAFTPAADVRQPNYRDPLDV